MRDRLTQQPGTWLDLDKAGSRSDDEGSLIMWARVLVHRLALAVERRDPSTRTAKTLLQADSMVTAVSRRAARKQEHRKAAR
jgi:hypothetical protein